jgi:excisionase family DNA binding protein
VTAQVDDLLTVDEVAVWLRVGRQTLYRWRYEHRGPTSFHVGKALRYRRSDVAAWISEQIESTSRL